MNSGHLACAGERLATKATQSIASLQPISRPVIFTPAQSTIGKSSLTAAIGLKRLAIAVAAILAAAFVTLVALSILIPAASVREAVQSEIRAVTGLDPMLGNDISLSLFPSGAVTFHKVMLGDNHSAQPAVTADELTARLRYFPLLAGRIEIADVTLTRPVINVTFAAGGESNWSGLIDFAVACARAQCRPPYRFILGDRHSGRHGRRA